VRAVDTNILARYYLRDDAAQGRVAAGVLSAGDVVVPKTVVLELEWVLRYVADQSENKVIECLAHLNVLPGVTVEDRDEIEAALAHSRYRQPAPPGAPSDTLAAGRRACPSQSPRQPCDTSS
jgi:predicted nucleic-acid-binding protein